MDRGIQREQCKINHRLCHAKNFTHISAGPNLLKAFSSSEEYTWPQPSAQSLAPTSISSNPNDSDDNDSELDRPYCHYWL